MTKKVVGSRDVD